MSTQNDKKLFSIIVPMYNVGEYVRRSLHSALKQDIPLESYEILAVDDHSTDDSAKVVEAFMATTPNNIRLLTNTGKGMAPARNYGLAHARGRYILYLDADDRLKPNVLGQIAEAMDADNLDMLYMTYVQESEARGEYKGREILKREKNDTRILTGRDFLMRDNYRVPVWLYAYRRDFLQESGVEMKDLPHEDENFTPRIIARARRIRYLPIELYAYFVRAESFMNSYKPQNLMGLIEGVANLRDDIGALFPEDKPLNRKIAERVSSHVFNSIRRAAKQGFGNEQDILDYARIHGLLPLRYHGFNVWKFMFNRSPQAYIRSCHKKARKGAARQE